jgi:hypothetical protein
MHRALVSFDGITLRLTRITASLNRIKEESFDPALVKHDLLKPADSWNRVWDAITSSNNAVLVRIPQIYFEHMIRLNPGTVSKSEGIENLQRTTL